MEDKSKITKFEIIDHGVDHEQYFQGCGVAFTEFDQCYTGIGESKTEAFNDALDQIAVSGYDVPSKLEKFANVLSDVSANLEHEDMHVYVSVRIKF